MKLFLTGVLLLVVATFSPFACGQANTTFWFYNSGGDFNNAGNWNNGVPNSTTTGIIDPYLGGTYTVNVTTGNSQNIAGLGVYGDFFNNDFGNTPGVVNLDLTSGSVLNVLGSTPSGVGTSGDIFVDYSGTLNVTGGALQLQNGELRVGDIYGSSTLNLNSTSFNFDYQTTGNYSSLTVGEGSPATAGASAGYLTENNSTVTTGNELYIGTFGGTGNYVLENNSTLKTGTAITTPAPNAAANYYVVLGSNSATGQSSVGTLTIQDSSTLTINPNTDVLLGTVVTDIGGTLPVGVTGGSGIINQTGTTSHFNLTSSLFSIGAYTGGSGVYNLSAGTFTSTGSGVFVGSVTGATGTLNQSGGTMNLDANSAFSVGQGGTGAYNLSGSGTAQFLGAVTIGSTGTVTQSGTSVMTSDSSTTVSNGGTYTISGGRATFNSTLLLDGTLNINSSGSQAGLVQVSLSNLQGTGVINYGGGTIQLTGGVAGTPYVDNYSTALTANTSTINASGTALRTYDFGKSLSGAGGLFLVGNGSTVFNSALTETPGTLALANSYKGSTGITAGTLNVMGADVQDAASSSTLYAGNGGTLNLTLASGGLTYAGGVSGTGTLNVALNTAKDVFTIGGTSNLSGTLNIGAGAVGTLVVYNGNFGTITDGGLGSNVTVGSGSGSGTVTFGSGTSYTGLTTVNSRYTLNATTLHAGVTNKGTLNVSTITGNTSVAANVVNNSGTLNATTIGLNVATNSGYLDATTIDANVASSSGYLAATGITGNVVSTGTLASNGTLGTVTNAPTVTIGGTLDSTGTLAVRYNGSTTDNFQVNGIGASTVSGNVLVDILQGGKIGTTTYTIVNAPGGVTAPGGLSSSSSAVFQYNVVVNAKNVQLQINQVPLTNFAQNQNQHNVAQVLDGTTSSLFSIFAKIPLSGASTIPTALNQLSPEALQYPRNIAFENSTFLVQTVDSAEANFRAGYAGLDSSGLNVMSPGFTTGLGRSLGSMVAYDSPAFHQAAPNGVNYYPGGDDTSSATSPSTVAPSSSSSSPAAPTSDSMGQTISDSPVPLRTSPNQSLRAPSFSEFIGGDVILSDLQNESSSTKITSTGGDAVAGVTFRMTSNLSAGVLFDFNHTSAKTDAYGSTTNVNTYSPGLFATYFEKGFYLNGLFSYGFNTYSNTRNVPFTGSTATSSPDGQQFVTNLDGGYDFHPNHDWTVGPTLGLTYTHLNVDSYTETGAESTQSDLAVQSQSANSLRSRLGGHAMYQTHVGSVLLQPNLSLMWQHEYLNDASDINYQFSNPGFTSDETSFNTGNPNRDSALIGCGLTAVLDTQMAVYINYFADVGGSNNLSQSVIGGFKASF